MMVDVVAKDRVEGDVVVKYKVESDVVMIVVVISFLDRFIAMERRTAQQ
jgi:hypothetical protein